MQGAAAAQQQAVSAAGPALSLKERVENVPTGTGKRVKEPLSMKAQLIFDTCWKKM